jgi:beta-xylosidase
MTYPLKTSFLAAIVMLSAASMSAQPAAILEGYNADPAIRVFGSTYYIYPTTDKPRWSSNEFSVWSSTDLIHWENKGVILNLPRDVSWGRRNAWAPDCVERNGKYYFYFGADGKIGVATSTSPIGVFSDALGQPLLQTSDTVKIAPVAPCVFIDDDGRAYIYYGSSQNQGFVQAAPLNADMITLQDSPTSIPITSFREGIVVFKRKGQYYFMWTAANGSPSSLAICYGLASSPLGHVVIPTQSQVLTSSGPVIGTGYHDVLNIPGTDRWYLVYTRWAIPNGAGDHRQVCLARLEFNADGTIKPIDPLQPVFAQGDSGEPLVNGRGHR